MRDTMNDRIEPATEEDLVYPDESSEFFSAEELEEEKKAHVDNNAELEKMISQRQKMLLKEGDKFFNNSSPARNHNRQKR